MVQASTPWYVPGTVQHCAYSHSVPVFILRIQNIHGPSCSVMYTATAPYSNLYIRSVGWTIGCDTLSNELPIIARKNSQTMWQYSTSGSRTVLVLHMYLNGTVQYWCPRYRMAQYSIAIPCTSMYCTATFQRGSISKIYMDWVVQ